MKRKIRAAVPFGVVVVVIFVLGVAVVVVAISAVPVAFEYKQHMLALILYGLLNSGRPRSILITSLLIVIYDDEDAVCCC